MLLRECGPMNPPCSDAIRRLSITEYLLHGPSPSSRAVTLLAAKIPLDHDARIRALGLQYPGLDLATPYDDKFNSLSDKGAICPPPWASKLFLRCFLPRPYDTEEQRASPWISPGRASDNDLRSFPPTQIVTAQNDHYRVVSAHRQELSSSDGAHLSLCSLLPFRRVKILPRDSKAWESLLRSE